MLFRSILKSAGLTIQCALPADGVCSAQATLRGKLVARGSAGGSYGGLVPVRLRLTPSGRATLRAGGGRMRITVSVPGVGVITRYVGVAGT